MERNNKEENISDCMWKKKCGSIRQDEGVAVKKLKRTNTVEQSAEELHLWSARSVLGAGQQCEWGAFIIIGSYLHPLLSLTSILPLT